MKGYIVFLLFILQWNRIGAQTDSIDIKIGQMLMVDFLGKHIDEGSVTLRDIRKGLIGGVLIYERNLDSAHTMANLKKMTSILQGASTIPLFISMDEEGGKVNRLKQKYGFKEMPSAKDIGDRHNDVYTERMASIISETLHMCGINLNFAPVIDLDNPHCPVLGKLERCYSSNPDTVAHDAAIFIKAHHKNSVGTVIKHFPGHGNSIADSHSGLADVTNTWTEEELKPFKILINKGMVDAIMTAHVVNKTLDSAGIPATLSKEIITGLLRNTLKYNGVIISDHIQMKAIRSLYSLSESLKLCINAGVDIILFSNTNKDTPEYIPSNVHDIIKGLVKSGDISEERINESFERIMTLKKKRLANR